MSECSHDCSSCGSSCVRRDPKSFLAEQNPYSNVKKVIGVISGKGGVGKSLVTALLASEFNRSGRSAAVLDADITGPSIPKLFGITEKAESKDMGIIPAKSAGGIRIMSVNLLLDDDETPVVWRGPVIAGAVKQFWSDVLWEDVDCMFVDMPPGTGDVALTVFQSLPVDGIIVVTSPQELARMIVAKAVNMAEMMSITVLGLIENMSYFICPNCKEKHFIFGDSHADSIAEKFGIDTVAQIPIDPAFAAACDEGRIEEFKNSYLSDIIKKIENL